MAGRSALPGIQEPAPSTSLSNWPIRGKLDLFSRILFYLTVGVLHLLSLLPDFILYPLGIVSGYVGYRLDRRRRKIGMRNLAIALPERDQRQRRRVLRASYVNLGRSAAEYVRLGGFFYRRLKKRVVYNDRLDYWKELRQRHSWKGLLILTAHLGNFELLPAAHAMRRSSFRSLAKSPRPRVGWHVWPRLRARQYFRYS